LKGAVKCVHKRRSQTERLSVMDMMQTRGRYIGSSRDMAGRGIL